MFDSPYFHCQYEKNETHFKLSEIIIIVEPRNYQTYKGLINPRQSWEYKMRIGINYRSWQG